MPRASAASFTKTGALMREFICQWLGTGAGASVPLKTNGIGAVLTRQGVGLYTLTFSDVGGTFGGFKGTTHTVATVSPQVWKYVGGTFVGSTKVIQIECWNLVTPALADPPATANTIVDLETKFLDNVVN